VSGWYGQSLFAKPYLTVDSNEHVYFSDPEGFRVFVTDRNGRPLRSFGDYGTDASAFSMPTGLAAASNGLLYIADADNQRVMRIKIDQLELNNALAPAK
jgi:sugar lactone lactonase YvrE